MRFINVRITIAFVLLYCICTLQEAITQDCDNLDFEQCNYAQWEIFRAENKLKKNNSKPFTFQNEAKVQNWNNVNSVPENHDCSRDKECSLHYISNGGLITVGFGEQIDEIPMIFPNGGNCSAILGDFFTSGARVSIMRRRMLVTEQTDILRLRYAVVLEDPGHTEEDQPFFIMNVLTEAGEPIECASYSAVAGDGQAGWKTINHSKNGVSTTQTTYKPWEEIFVPLKELLGQTVTIEVVVADCARGGHAGFALVDLQCGNSGLDIRPVNGCEFPYIISGPTGVASYSWSTGQTTKDIEVNAPGTYTVDVIPLTGAGCSVTLEAEVEKLDELVLSVEGEPAICAGDSAQLSVSGADSYSWSPEEGISDPTSPNPIVNPLATTTYTISGSSLDGCQGEQDLTIEVNPLPLVDAGEDIGICEEETVQLEGSGAVAYRWKPSNRLSNPNISNPRAEVENTTTFTLTGISPEGCEAQDEVTVNVSAPAAVIVSQEQTICLGETVELSAQGAESYSWSPAESLSDPTIANPVASPSETTTYTLTATAAGGCELTREVKVNVIVPEVNAGPDLTLCFNSSSQLSARGAETYEWFPAEGLSNTFSPTPIAQPIQQTTYTLIGTDQFGCVDSDQVTIFLGDEFIIDPGEDTVICEGDSLELVATGGSNYIWQPSSGLSNPALANPIAFPANTITYTVNAEDGAGCQGSAEITITVKPGVTLEVEDEISVCEGETAQLTALGADTYEWEAVPGLSNTQIANPTITPDEDMTISLVGRNDEGCEDNKTVAISVRPIPEVEAGQDQTICGGGDVTLDAEGAATYAWLPIGPLSDPNIENPVASPDSTTLFVLTGTNEFGCTQTDSLTVFVGTELDPSAGESIEICEGESVELQGSGGKYFDWQPIEGMSDPTIANPIVSPQSSTIYLLTVSDDLGCTGSAQVRVRVNPHPTVSAGPDMIVCPGGEAKMNGTGGLNYSWTPTIGLSDPNQADPFVTPISSTTYILTASDENGCEDSDTIQVEIADEFVLEAGEDLFICQGDTTSLSVSGGSNYTWTPSISLSDATISTPEAFPSTTTTYYASAFDPQGCQDTDSVTVNVYPFLAMSIVADQTICEGESVVLIAVGAGAYKWSPEDSIDSPTSPSIEVAPKETQIYHVIGTDDNGCTANGKVVVTVIPLPDVYAGLDTAMCLGDVIELDGSGADEYSWQPEELVDDPASRNPFASVEENVWLTLLGTRDGCSNQDSLFIERVIGPPATVSDAEICEGDTAILIAEGGSSYLWANGDTSRVFFANPSLDTTYTVTAFSEEGCIGLADSAFVKVVPIPAASFVPSDSFGVLPLTVSFANETVGGANYVWHFGDGSTSEIPEPTHTFRDNQEFQVEMVAFNELGCPDTVSFEILVDNYNIYVPTAFTPNGDGKNDVFKIGSFNFEYATVQIFSRNGRLIYESLDKDFEWDGTTNGVSVPEGNYVCKIVGQNISGGEMTIVKMVTLLR